MKTILLLFLMLPGLAYASTLEKMWAKEEEICSGLTEAACDTISTYKTYKWFTLQTDAMTVGLRVVMKWAMVSSSAVMVG